MNRASVVVGDARELPLHDNSVDLIVTSPPYFGLRTYGEMHNEIGGESTVTEYLLSISQVLSECQRVLKPSGSIFMVIGDKYVSDNRGSGPDQKRGNNKYAPAGNLGFVGREAAPKGSLLGLPLRVALAAIDLGLHWRQSIVWSKPNPLPDPATDRCSRAQESVLHFSKHRHYYSSNKIRGGHGLDVWEIPVQGYRDPYNRKHPAVYPEALVERCVRGWCPPGGFVVDPFTGSGTTLSVAWKLGFSVFGVDANPDYVAIAETRLGLDLL